MISNSLLNEVFIEDGDASFFIEVAAPLYAWVHSWHGAIGSRGVHLLTIFVIEDEVKG